MQSSALMRKHPTVTGESPSAPTASADFCFMKGRDAVFGDGIQVLVMRESQTRSLFSHACAGKSISREGYSGYLIEKCVEDIDTVQKDVHLKTDQEPAMLAVSGPSPTSSEEPHYSDQFAQRRSPGQRASRERSASIPKHGPEDEGLCRVAPRSSVATQTSPIVVAH